MMVVVNTKNDCSKRIASKRSTPSIYKKKTVRVRGFVDRISNGIVVVVIRNPIDNESVKEIYVPVSKFPKRVPEEGDYVSVTVNVY
ncbi:MAG: hypothetical protein II567_13705 [Candidatus Riflebacteria bacterium]|nr:hypothetical protein [Candidatus Riflebacteria bacterium]